MKKLLCIFLIIFSSQSFAEWEHIITDIMETEGYVDFDNIRESDGYIFFWQLINYAEPQEFPEDGESHHSYIMYMQADCKLFRTKILQATPYSQIFGKGYSYQSVEGDGSWKYPPPKTIMDRTLKRVCK